MSINSRLDTSRSDQRATTVSSFENSTLVPPEDTVVQRIDDGVSLGYQCAKVVEDNEVHTKNVRMFVDIGFPIGSEELALQFLQEELIEGVAFYFGVSTGERCDNPFFGSTWLVQIVSKTTDWRRDTAAESCRSLQFDAETEECHVYQVGVTGGVLTGEMKDVINYMEFQFNSGTWTENSPYRTQFLAVATEEMTSEMGRDNLGAPSSINEQQVQREPENDRQTVTIVGGLLVAAFCMAFLGIALLVRRRRQEWVARQAEGDMDEMAPPRDFDHEMDAKHLQMDTHPMEDDNDEYGTREQLRSELYEANAVDHLEIDVNGQVRRSQDSYEDEDLQERENTTSNFMIDMGTSFKDQLMGVYGKQRPKDLPTMYGVRQTPSSDSDLDSWAQTDGTIGSLEQTLEPITAEV